MMRFFVNMLRINTLFIFILSVFSHSFALDGVDSVFSDAIIYHAESVSNDMHSFEKLSEQLTNPFNAEQEKLAVIYAWLAINVDYAIERTNTFRTYKSEEEVLDYVLKTNRGVCLHYSLYFNELCKYAGLQSEMISGYVKQNGRIQQTPHTWNSVKLDGKWFMCDVTWAAGYVSKGTYYKKFNTKFFLITPNKFIQTHIPFDKMWQLINYPYTFDDFKLGYIQSDSTYFSFSDTLASYRQSSECHQLMQEKRRIENNGTISGVVSNELHYKNQNIQVCLHNQQANLINNGVSYYEKVVQQYNFYIEQYNNRFKSPVLNDEQISEIILTMNADLNKAKQAYQNVEITNEEIHQAIQHNLNSLHQLESQINKELEFLEKYLKTDTSKRMQLFYQRKFM